jgi:nitrate reductase gamma subunit
LPWPVKTHMVTGFLVIALFPFSRLVHLIMFPFWYLWRPYQLVIRNRPARPIVTTSPGPGGAPY